ncbi:hypothetical protein Bbelb_050980 [Branchiostoma belcheri]|nr:hypothetical protein Bbelb_050980 [Branchiostoma belcheri]
MAYPRTSVHLEDNAESPGRSISIPYVSFKTPRLQNTQVLPISVSLVSSDVLATMRDFCTINFHDGSRRGGHGEQNHSLAVAGSAPHKTLGEVLLDNKWSKFLRFSSPEFAFWTHEIVRLGLLFMTDIDSAEGMKEAVILVVDDIRARVNMQKNLDLTEIQRAVEAKKEVLRLAREEPLDQHVGPEGRLHGMDIQEFAVLRRQFVDCVIENLEDRFPQMDLLSAFSILDPSHLPADMTACKGNFNRGRAKEKIHNSISIAQHPYMHCCFSVQTCDQRKWIEFVSTVLLGDAAYPHLPWLMKPYPDNGHLSEEKTTFNYRLSQARMTVECAFGRLKGGRWRCLSQQLNIDLDRVPTVVTACCVLHNVCEEHGENYFNQWNVPAAAYNPQVQKTFPHIGWDTIRSHLKQTLKVRRQGMRRRQRRASAEQSNAAAAATQPPPPVMVMMGGVELGTGVVVERGQTSVTMTVVTLTEAGKGHPAFADKEIPGEKSSSCNEQLKRELDKMTAEHVIGPVTVPTSWVSSLVTVMKPRSHYPAPVIEDIVPELKKAKVFSVLDAKSGYWQIALDKESSMLTTFNTPNGRYKWKRLPLTFLDNVWRALKDKLTKKNFDASKMVKVKFISEEDTLDFGGPKNEMFRMALQGIFETSGFFEHSPHGYLPISSPIAIVNGDFETAGEAMVMSIVHLGPTPSCLHPAIVSALCGENLPDMSGFQPVDQEAAAFVAKLESATEASLKDLLQSDARHHNHGRVAEACGKKQHDANEPRVVVVMEVKRSNINAKFLTGGFGKTWDASGYDTAICDLCQLSEMVFDPKNGTTEVRTFTVEGRKHPLEDNRRTRNRVASAPTTNTPDQHHHPYHGRILTTTPSPIPRPYPDYDTITHTTAVS